MHVTHGYPAGFDFLAQQVSQHDVQFLNTGGAVARYRDKNVRYRCQLTAGPAGESYRGEAGSPRLSYAFHYAGAVAGGGESNGDIARAAKGFK